MATSSPSFDVNPFATRYVCPGTLPWLDSGEQSMAELVTRFQQDLASRAAVIGPHGSGKSTLLENLLPHLGNVVYRERLGETVEIARYSVDVPVDRPIVWLALRRGNSPLQRVLASRQYWGGGGLLVIDGFEQLSAVGRWLALRMSARKQMGILVTAHSTLGLSTLIETRGTEAILRRIVDEVFRRAGLQVPAAFTDDHLLSRLFAEEDGNLREVLMRLYDIASDDLPM